MSRIRVIAFADISALRLIDSNGKVVLEGGATDVVRIGAESKSHYIIAPRKGKFHVWGF